MFLRPLLNPAPIILIPSRLSTLPVSVDLQPRHILIRLIQRRPLISLHRLDDMFARPLAVRASAHKTSLIPVKPITSLILTARDRTFIDFPYQSQTLLR